MAFDYNSFETDGINTDTLNNIISDDKVIIEALAKQHYDDYVSKQNSKLWFGLYTLEHNNFSANSGDNNIKSYCCLNTNRANSFYGQIHNQLSLESKNDEDLLVVSDLPKWLKNKDTGQNYADELAPENKGVHYEFGGNNNDDACMINEKIGFYNHAKQNIRHGAVINASFLRGNGPIYYEGYASSFTGAGRNNGNQPNSRGPYSCSVDSAFTRTSEEYTIFTLGGAPIGEDNWIIAFVERGVCKGSNNWDASIADNYIENYKTQFYQYSTNSGTVPNPRDLSDDTSLAFNMVLHINFFLPNGVLVKTKLDRTARYFRNTAVQTTPILLGATEYNTWVSRDYANTKAINKNITFKDIWNQIYDGTYIQYGRVRDQNFNPKSLTDNSHWLYYWDNGYRMPNPQIIVYNHNDIKSYLTYDPDHTDYYSSTQNWTNSGISTWTPTIPQE